MQRINIFHLTSSILHLQQKGRYILLSAHREENIDTEKNFMSLFTAINRMAEKYDMPILYSCHPRSRKRLEAAAEAPEPSRRIQLDPRVIQHEPLGFHDYNCLQMGADWRKVHTGILLSGYISETHTHVPGPDDKFGYGGKCFPKDVNAFAKMTKGTPMGTLLEHLHELNVHF